MTTPNLLRLALRPLSRTAQSLHRRYLLEKYIRRAGNQFIGEEPVNLRKIKDFRRENFPDSGPVPWLDRPDAEAQIETRLQAGKLTDEQADRCRFWHKNGYLILDGFHTHPFLDAVWEGVETAIRSGRVPVKPDSMTEGGDYEDRYQDLHLRVPELRQLLFSETAVEFLNLLLGVEIIPFQTLAFYYGSEQKEHSDFVHMTTYPVGYLAATWSAIEDVHPDSGPLVYYPGSHKLPYYLSREVGIPREEMLRGDYHGYRTRYEPFVQNLIAEHNFERHEFTPKKGDLLIWHANLIHGGSPRRDQKHSRKSIVCHYFGRGSVCYQDLIGCIAQAY